MKFHKIKSSQNEEIILLFTDISKLCPSREFYNVSNMSFNLICENKILAKISEFTVKRTTTQNALNMSDVLI